MNENLEFNEFHWLLAVVQSIDVGVVVLDRDYRVQVWNTFMENRSGLQPHEVHKQSLFSLFPEIEENWFRHKVEGVVTLGTPAFTIWEQRPYLVKFKNYQPITGQEEYMFQNTTILPLQATNTNIEHICLIIYDVTSVAINKQQLQATNLQLQQLSRTDRLTGLNNRGYWEECLQHEYARHRRYQSMAALVMFDIDHFKKVNDTYGHPAGDKVIQAVAAVVREQVRDTDIAGRYGGEEFVVLLPDVDSSGAMLFAERLRLRIESLLVSYEGQTIPFTISLGVADLSHPVQDYPQLIEHADQALYASKQGGRNQVNCYGG
ncbi:sensor domain-containing diguanylate cyclase [Pseudomonas sp. sp1636]|uniref:sensor domain-containing diguanylate cyclase n=1 Tax=Pseudomonas sp. sp1636 TaxID=3036707 RepID=UPI0025A503FF|nr:sensor domain-containing diguanylate cyclase [Pseudomonas sp. sp1636]MDM8349601.1 sensor domain-containing diguanylate cyclase [Pseudomonas sp. sp1636]